MGDKRIRFMLLAIMICFIGHNAEANVIDTVRTGSAGRRGMIGILNLALHKNHDTRLQGLSTAKNKVRA